MLLRESASAEICGILKAHGISSPEQYESDAGLVLTRLQESNGAGKEFSEWFQNRFGKRRNAVKATEECLKGYWKNYLRHQFVI